MWLKIWHLFCRHRAVRLSVTARSQKKKRKKRREDGKTPPPHFIPMWRGWREDRQGWRRVTKWLKSVRLRIFSPDPRCPFAVWGALVEPPVLGPRGDDKPVMRVYTTGPRAWCLRRGSDLRPSFTKWSNQITASMCAVRCWMFQRQKHQFVFFSVGGLRCEKVDNS